ncbi:Asp-tRNA(Asn)/Glu-tRNA(Gln) amidotransferase subunit GatC [Psychrobacter pygoscelis]|uniref:Asp-tRNA(Asn)/Glu-tRNA(Gln) amidotransferase subunit GatC n=1 Tax=Psychrobacter pygoscelis TaxID=2488563 RepID=UPI00103F3E3B|nr:Asp-tRNA(Asn)/Glu-tRNA(Gln) amidotransferase subunit GatC [Psychrobacter pygoscelis]
MSEQTTPANDSVSTDDILEVARLARLGVDQTTASSYADDIDKILGIMQTISTVDTEGLAPLANIHQASQELRSDRPDADIDREHNQSVAPAVAEGLYLVPQVIE